MTGTTASGPHDTTLLDQVLAGTHPDFALLHRPRTGPPGRIEVLVGDTAEVAALAGIPLAGDTPDSGGAPPAGAGGARHEVLAVIPYRQLAERGFDVVDDGSPVLTLRVRAQASLPVGEALARIPDVPAGLTGGDFDLDDDAYADIVRRVLAEEIGTGQGANFVVRRTFLADVSRHPPTVARAVFRRLVERERGAYWTFVVHTGGRTFVGATPERHLSLSGGLAVMNPISGTLRHPPQGPTLDGVLSFLADPKEADELSMVLDEELKMVARISDSGVRVRGPHFVEMAGLAHTEYSVEGRTSADVRDALRETLFAPTVTGSPLESAARAVRRFEPHGRGYYSGVMALIGRDAWGGRTLDSSILIRTAVVEDTGRLSLGVGATLVRDSDPRTEAAETRAKAAGLLDALGHGAGPRPARPSAAGTESFARHPEVLAALRERNSTLSAFWLDGAAAAAGTDGPTAALAGRSVLVVDAEDSFTAMWDHQLRSLGTTVTVRRFDERYDTDDFDLVLLGPGPGDPRQAHHPKIGQLRAVTRGLLDAGRPFLSVCLSHQVLCGLLGLDVIRRDRPDQGVQKKIDLFGRPELVGFYNTFAARADANLIVVPEIAGAVEVSLDTATAQVHALRGQGFRSVQFHPESVLTPNGVRITADLLAGLLAETDSPSRPHSAPPRVTPARGGWTVG